MNDYANVKLSKCKKMETGTYFKCSICGENFELLNKESCNGIICCFCHKYINCKRNFISMLDITFKEYFCERLFYSDVILKSSLSIFYNLRFFFPYHKYLLNNQT